MLRLVGKNMGLRHMLQKEWIVQHRLVFYLPKQAKIERQESMINNIKSQFSTKKDTVYQHSTANRPMSRPDRDGLDEAAK